MDEERHYVAPVNRPLVPGRRSADIDRRPGDARVSEVWSDSRHELHELFDGQDIVVASVSWHTRSRGSDSELVQEEAHTWTIRDGRIARFEWGRDLDAALRAVGLRT